MNNLQIRLESLLVLLKNNWIAILVFIAIVAFITMKSKEHLTAESGRQDINCRTSAWTFNGLPSIANITSVSNKVEKMCSTHAENVN